MYTKHLIIGLIFTATIGAFAQKPQADRIKTDHGEITIQPILHGTLALKWNNKTILVDPYGGAKAMEGIGKPDIVLITDIHGDHLNSKTLKILTLDNTHFIAPQAVADQLPTEYHQHLKILKNQESTTLDGISIRAVAMYNLPESPDAKHVKGRGNGYVLAIDGKQIYISGDTEDIPEMRKLQNIDVAFVCMNLPYTMDITQAASAVLDFKPKIIYPYHYRGNPDMSDTEAFKTLVLSKDQSIDVRLRNWYPAYD